MTYSFGGSSYANPSQHIITSNYLFADGHVKALPGQMVSAGYNNQTSTATNCSGQSSSTNCAVGTSGKMPSGAQVVATFSVY